MKNTIEYKSRFRILKGGKIALVISAMMGSVTLSMASPSGGVVTTGSAAISQIDNTTNINQSTNKATINWNTFNIASNETVNFNQPDINSITLNRVIGSEQSIINGALNANGQVWLLNSNGVLFGSSAKVNTSGLIATTKNLSDADFNNNNYIFNGDSTNSVINLGTIDIANSGYATLIANSVTNEGTIKAIKGTIRLVGANEVSINLNGNSMLNLTIDKGVLDALVKNSGSLYANAGEIYLTTNAVNDLLKGVVNNSGIIEAQSLDGVTGKIELLAHGEVQVGGTLKAEGGLIKTSGEDYTIADNTLVQTGTWFIEQDRHLASEVDMTIDAGLASAIQTQLASGDAQVTAKGTAPGFDFADMNVNAPISWSTNTLTLNAQGSININATLNATATAGLALEYAQTTGTETYNISAPVNLASTASYSTKKGTAAAINYIIINSLGEEGSTTGTDLQGIKGDQVAEFFGENINYVLGSNIDTSATSTWNAGAGFKPLGDSTYNFVGTLDGLGHTISNLYINRPNTDYVGLFYITNTNATIMNLGFVANNITGNNLVGSLVGQTLNTTIHNVYATGTVTGQGYVGGLVGNGSGTISNSYATGNVIGASDYVGGLAGRYDGTISNSYATGDVTGALNYVGGLVGKGGSGTISNSYATGDVTTTAATSSTNGHVGGLAGTYHGTISNSYATGKVSGTGAYAGGLIGLTDDAVITNSYATGAVNGYNYAGGLVAKSLNGTTITNSYATGAVSGNVLYTGGLTGDTSSTVTNSFWDMETSGQTTSGGGTGLTTVQMKDTKTFYDAGWDLNTIWGRDTNNVENSGYVGLRVLSDFDFNTVVAATLVNQTKIYNGTSDVVATFSDNYVVNTIDFGTKNVGSQTFTSDINDYTISYLTGIIRSDGIHNYSSSNTEVLLYTSGAKNITQKALSFLANDKVYDTTTTATTTLSGVISGDTVSSTATASFDNKNAGVAKTVTLNSATLTGTDSANYSIATGQTTTADVTQKALTLSGITASNKVYDATTTATSTATLAGIIAGDSVSNSITSSFSNKNAGTAKTVTLDSVTLVGTDSANYSIASGQTTTADITQKALTLSGIIGNNKVYDGTTDATASATLTGLIAGDTLTIASTFDNKNAGTGKTLTLNSLTGTDGANYSVTLGQTTTADITQKALSFLANDKVYDTTTTATTTLSGVISGDTVSSTATASFDNKNAGVAKTVTLNSATLTGTDSANYSIATGQTTTADITQKALTLSGITGNNKVYDGTTTATTTATLAGIIAGDSVSNSIASSFGNKNAGTAKTVTLDSVTLVGTDSANYSIASGQTTTADITQKALTLSGIIGNNKVYDGTTDATASATLAGIIAGDSVSNSIASTFGNKNVGIAKTVTLNSLTGTDSTNYSIATGQTTTANITTPISPILNSIISSITNESALKATPQLSIIAPIVVSGNTNALAIEPLNQPSKLISMNELKTLNNTKGDLQTKVYKDSPLLLIDSGIQLPSGIEQQFFVPEDYE